MNQGATTGQIDELIEFNLLGNLVSGTTPISGNIVLQPGEFFSFITEFSFALNLAPDSYNIETQVVPVI